MLTFYVGLINFLKRKGRSPKQVSPARTLATMPRGRSGSISAMTLAGDGVYLIRKVPYAERIPVGMRTPIATARKAIATERLPPALSPHTQIFSAVVPSKCAFLIAQQYA